MMSEPTDLQIKYVRGMQQQLRLPDALLNNHCVQRFGRPLWELTVAEASRLIDEMKAWQAVPPDLQRAAGQRDLPGLEAS